MLVNEKLACSTTNATYGGGSGSSVPDGKEWQTITKMHECTDPIQVKKGDKVKITATYDMKAHPAREPQGEGQEVMGVMTYVFVPSENRAPWSKLLQR